MKNPKNVAFLTAAITKFDEETRTVEGVCTAEELDKQNEIMDYESAKTAIEGTWPGNLREMHQPIAAGTGVVIKCDDEKKSITIRGTISKGAPATWEKVKDGTLKFFSVRGLAKSRQVEKVGDIIAKRVFFGRCDEISLVDNGACPSAGFAIVKVADGLTADLADTAVEKIDRPSWNISTAARLIEGLNALMATEMYQVNDAVIQGKAPSPCDVAQLALLKASTASLLAYLQAEFAAQFAEAAAADPEVEAPVAETETEEIVVERLATLASSAMTLLGARSEAIEKAGARHSKKDQDMIQAVHDQAVTLGGVCTKADKEEKTEKKDDAKDDDTAKFATAIKASGVDRASIVSFQLLDADGKALGAPLVIDGKEVAKAAVPAVPVAKADEPAVVVKIADLPEVQKLFDELKATNETQKATLTEQSATIADLKTRLDVVEKQPAAGGPAVRVAEKSIGTAPGEAPAGALSDADALTAVIKGLPEGQTKDELLAKLISVNAAAGVGVTITGPGGRQA